MIEGGKGGLYPDFIRNTMAAVAPLLPDDVDAKLGFSGCCDGWGWPCADSATLRGERALFLEQLAQEAEAITGVEAALYVTRPGLSGVKPILDHSAYARNIRRWETGTLPRKRKARSDFVLVAACWLFGWGVQKVASSGLNADARATVLGWTGMPDDDEPDIISVVSALWQSSDAAYRLSLAGRRSTEN